MGILEYCKNAQPKLTVTQILKEHQASITGVLHHTHSEQHYTLRRYLPQGKLAHLVEQFWIVDWALNEGQSHIQTNLPDPNCHLYFEQGTLKVIGPVSTAYRFEMQGEDRIIGVKFTLGTLALQTGIIAADLVDNTVPATQVFDFADRLESELLIAHSDADIIRILQLWLTPLACKPPIQLAKTQTLIQLIKQHADITQVAQLSQHASTPKRVIQNYFKQYIGLSPKWLIRKYRLHQALELLDLKNKDIIEVATWLGYTDQSHFIRDFKAFTGTTPKAYCRQC
ncbi:hypothetical protein PSECIP111951_00891 [Pseudoalteromonas holothuriae]|uniref:HTH araC/xylS-type domain-containing protein n=1 Tax=Pseudoalteromonas holothuriae TaxID=2963714 RepID=A0A9W4VQD3_9GAMM|nr:MULTISPECIES: helix-turn-helix domain-containing protein [unclassified Pseudoalteromonas]CAH9053775.1 hypothetical protein PSECIP111951_00891 [Pseudoalteromonas sp. CIP111951]CAH9055832.1 hypothetical protein PSECIP111854_01659 [Pseudoalteromonas sp. CIP111854]